MNNISFTSILTPVTKNEFFKISASIGYDSVVDYPYSVSSSVVKQNVRTNNICDCTACLVTDGEKALLMHLLPSTSANHDTNRVYNYISQNFNLHNNNNLQAVLVGSHMYKASQNIINNFIKFFNKFKIPTTILKTGLSPTDIAYKTSTDKVYITNNEITEALRKGKSKTEALNSGFNYTKISEADEIK